jgi:hypothetical protein
MTKISIMDLKTYIKNVRKITITQAATEIGYTREHLTEVCNGLAAGRKLGMILEKWSGGIVKAADICFPKNKYES